jgi:hypothetical protein
MVSPLVIVTADWASDGTPADQSAPVSHLPLELIQLFVVNAASAVGINAEPIRIKNQNFGLILNRPPGGCTEVRLRVVEPRFGATRVMP